MSEVSVPIEDWLRFANLQLPARAANLLLETYGTPSAVFAAPPGELQALPGIAPSLAARAGDPSYAPKSAQIAYLERNAVSVLIRGSAGYPETLAALPDAPPLLFARGTLLESDKFAVALVGTRRATAYGSAVTTRLARDLVEAGMTVVSGGALGIDSIAHRAAAEANGRTLVVLGCGLDVRYPAENQPLFQQIVERGLGAIVTEFPLGAQPDHWRFPLRNRIISGLSMGVVVVEAGEQSGALLTAALAAEQSREVMAVPGNVDRPYSRGANALIQDGAALVRNAEDVLQVLGVLTLRSPKPEHAPRYQDLPAEQRRVLEKLDLTPRHVDALAAEAQMTSVEVGVHLTILELAGLVRRLPGNSYVRTL